MTVTLVQSHATTSAAATSLAGTLPSGVAQGNLLVATVSCGNNTTTFTGPSLWTQATINQPSGVADTQDTSIWWTVVSAGQSGATSWTWTLSATHNPYICIEEWHSTTGWPASPVDVTANGETGTPAQATTVVSGTTATTAQASELWVASLMYDGGAQTESSITSGWTKDVQISDSTPNHTVTMLYNIASSTGTAACQYTIGTAEYWCGCVVTFKPGIQTDKDIVFRGVLSATKSKDLTWRSNISKLADKDLTWRSNIGHTIRKDSLYRAVLSALIGKNSVFRGNIALLIGKNSIFRGNVGHTSVKDSLYRAVLSKSISKNTAFRAPVSQILQKNTSFRGNVGHTAIKDILFRGVISAIKNKNSTFRGNVAILRQKDTSFRGNIITPPLTSGGFALFANGTTGTASFDHFRVTEYPDPSLSLAPLIPRLGFSSVSWNSQLATNTTLGVDASLDGVNWTDITASNGLPLPLLTAQPAFVVDGFSTNTSANYTSTFRTGGSVATWTIDTTNSRLIAVGGTNALYISNQVNRADVDLFVDLNRSDTGGIVWRYTDANNFYFATFTDSLSTSTQQTVTINRVAANVLTTLATASISFQRTLVTRCRVSMLASLITATVDGVVVATYTDGSPLSGTSIGVYANGGTNYCTQLWIQPQGDYVTGTPPLDTVTGDFVYTRQRLATTDPSVTPYVLDFTISTANPDINQGTLIPSTTYDHTLVAANFDDLAKQSNFSWYINNREVIFRTPGAVPSPWVIQSAANGLTSWIEPDSNLIVTQANNALYRNRQVLTNVIGTDAFSNSFVNSSATSSFTLSYPVAIGTIPIITLGGIVQTVGLKGTVGSQWYYAEGDATIAQDTSGITANLPGVIVVNYTGTFIMTVVVDNTTAQAALALVENSSGIVEEVEDVSKLSMYYPAALTYAQQLLARYCLTGRTIVFKTYRNGLDLLQIGTFFFPEFNITDAQMLITEIDISIQTQPNNTVLYGYIVTATELPNIVSWSKLLGTLFLSGA